MKYHVEEINNEHHYWIVVDEQGKQRGEEYLHPLHAQWAAEDLTNGKKLPSELTEEEAFDIAFGITGEIEEAHEQGRVIEHESIVETVRPDRDGVTISEKHETGEIIEYRGEKWLVTENFQITGNEYVHPEDEDMAPGWYSQLFRVRDKIEVARVISEQYQDGQARFTGPYTVKFSDEPLPMDMRTLKYSKELGLHQ